MKVQSIQIHWLRGGFLPAKNKIAKNSQTASSSRQNYDDLNYYFIPSVINFSSKKKKQFDEEELLKLIYDENKIGHGANSSVYSIPDSPDYVLKYLNEGKHSEIQIGDFPDSVNVGQPIWQGKNPRLLVLKRVRGKENSIHDWSHTIYNPETQAAEHVSKAQANTYFENIHTIAQMPQKTFDNLAFLIETAEEKSYKVDSVNPNNLLVDTDKNELNIIDINKVQPWDNEKAFHNSYYDMVASILDFTLMSEFYEKMNTEQKEEFLKDVALIDEKSKAGAVKSGLSTDASKYIAYILEVHKYTNPLDPDEKHIRDYIVRMIDFLHMLNYVQKWKKAQE